MESYTVPWRSIEKNGPPREPGEYLVYVKANNELTMPLMERLQIAEASTPNETHYRTMYPHGTELLCAVVLYDPTYGWDRAGPVPLRWFHLITHWAPLPEPPADDLALAVNQALDPLQHVTFPHEKSEPEKD